MAEAPRGRSGDAGEPDDHGGALVVSRAAGLDGTAMKLGDALHQREADAEAALLTVEGSRPLHEEIEHAGEQVRRDAHAVVGHAQDRLVAFTVDLDPDRAAA